MATIQLNHGQIALVDDDCVDMLAPYNWRAAKLGVYSNTLYAAVNIADSDGGRKLILMHRLILGLTDRSIVVDHINRDGLDNRRCNLRACTRAENACNRRVSRNNNTGYSGVTARKNGKFVAYITKNKQRICLGTFRTIEDAVRVRSERAYALFGNFTPV